ncbi:radical SAM protein [Desulfovibrio sp. JC010]|uniref:radical SAM protein n=1 Tax=Desulfovibrio sp. JC010 TaxID=2593641 RepID=UPI0013D8603B|nr:radical SAM protein [Desulfovibrio sp. JC010]NDV27496.1 radical SAM protein [Desulfovibrio sp. JC010]
MNSPSIPIISRIAIFAAGRSPACRRALEGMSDSLPVLPRWAREGREILHGWFRRSLSAEQTEKRGGDPETMERNCLTSYCSVSAFAALDKKMTYVAQKLGRSHVGGLTGAVLGCDWGYDVLYAAHRWNPASLLGLDSNGKYAMHAQDLLQRWRKKGLFHNVEIVAGGEDHLALQPEFFDFIIIKKSFSLMDIGSSRQELFTACAALKKGGVLLILCADKQDMAQEDIFQTLEVAGCPHAEVVSVPGTKHAIVVVKARHEELGRMDELLAKAGQDDYSLVSRLDDSGLPDDTAEERERKLLSLIDAKQSVLETLPLNYMLKVTSRCNIRCRFCDYSDIKRHYTVSPIHLHQIMATLGGTKSLSLSGGEPLLHPTTRLFMEKGAEFPDLKISLASNMLLASRDIDVMAESLYHVACSLDAATKGNYELVRTRSNWETVVGNLSALTQRREKLGYTHPTLSLSFIVMGHNIDEMADFVSLAGELGAGGVTFHWLCWTLTPRSFHSMMVDLTDDDVAHRLCAAIVEAVQRAARLGLDCLIGKVATRVLRERPELYEEYGLAKHCPPAGLAWGGGDIELKGYPCAMPFTWMRMTSPINACFCHNSLPKFRYIPIKSSGSLLENWNNDLFREAREHFYAGSFEQVCSPDCLYYQKFLKK